jgi:hypothetical protein
MSAKPDFGCEFLRIEVKRNGLMGEERGEAAHLEP